MNDPCQPGPRVLTALLTARIDKLEELSHTLESLLGGIRAQAGCLDSLVGRDLGGGSRFLLHCLWESPAALDAYLASEAFGVLRGASSILTGPEGFLVAIGHPESPPFPPPTSGPNPSTPSSGSPTHKGHL